MEKTTWKVLAIIFITLFILETAFVIWGMMLVSNEEAKTEECYYEVCRDYPDAWLEGNICSCFEYDILGNLVVSKTELIK